MNTKSLSHAFALGCIAAISVGCGSEPRPIPSTPIPVAPVGTSSHETTGPDMRDLPPVGEPKALEKAAVFNVPTKGSVRALGIASKNLPIVYLRIVVRAGHAMGSIMSQPGKSRAGIAEITAQLLKDGGAGRFSAHELKDRVDSLGTDLSVDVGLDRVVFGISVTKDKLDAALEILSAMVVQPHFDAGEFAKLKARELDRVRQAQKGNGGWAARLALYRELYGKGHPYAEVDATDESLQNIELGDVKAFYKKAYVAPSMFAVAAGDIDAADLAPRLDKYLKNASTTPAPTLTFTNPTVAEGRRVVLASKPDAKQADVFVGALAIPRKDERWPNLALAIQSLGGGMAARLFVDVREKRSLAYSTNAGARELASGPSLISLFAGTKTPSAPQSVQALLEHLQWISADKPVTNEELAIAKTSLETGFVFRLETIGSVAGLAIDKEVLGLPGSDVYDYVAQYRKALHDASIESVRAMAAERLRPEGIIISVAGDPKLAKPLSHFAPVRMVDPEKGFAVIRELPKDPNASMEVEKTEK